MDACLHVLGEDVLAKQSALAAAAALALDRRGSRAQTSRKHQQGALHYKRDCEGSG
jgi:hypothetical protein